LRSESKRDVLRIGYVPSLVAGGMPRVIERFQVATPKVRLELFDLSPGEMAKKASAGLLDLAVVASGIEASVPEFVWRELRRLAPVLVLSRAHPLAARPHIAPSELRDLPLFGLDRSNFPEYAPRLRVMLKPFGVTARFATRTADGIAPLFTALEAHHGAAVLTDGIAAMLPPTLTLRPFRPALLPAIIVVGTRAIRPSAHAEQFVQLLRAELHCDNAPGNS
jgi:DNA-binding transcriptional LysR family regulator